MRVQIKEKQSTKTNRAKPWKHSICDTFAGTASYMYPKNLIKNWWRNELYPRGQELTSLLIWYNRRAL